MNELIALRGTKADGRTIGAVPERSRPMHVVGGPLRGPAHGFASTAAGAHCKNRGPADVDHTRAKSRPTWSIARPIACD